MSRIVSAGLSVLAPVSILAPARAAAQTAAGLAGSPSMWHFEIGASGTWYENPSFIAVEGAPSTWSTQGRATLSRQQRFRKGTFSISGSGGRLYYPELKGLDQWTYGGVLGLDLAPSRSTTLTLSQTYDRSNTRRLPALDLEGLPVPTTGVDTASSGLALTHRMSRSFQLEINGDFTWRRYDNPSIVGGEQLHAGLQLVRLVGRDGGVYLSYDLSDSWIEGREDRVHVASLGVRKQPERGVGIELSGGAAYIERLDQYYPTGSAGLTARGHKASLSVGYQRDFGLAFGYGRQTIADLVRATLGWTPTERVTFRGGYSYGYRRDPGDEAFTVRSQVASGGFSWRVVSGLGFDAGYAWEDNRTEGFNEVRGSRTTASLSYGVDWR
jgi:hypothetical protein